MPDAGGPHDFTYVHTDIPEGMTIASGARNARPNARRRKLPNGSSVAGGARRPHSVGWRSCQRWCARGSTTARLTDEAPRARHRRAPPLVVCVTVTLIEGRPRHLPGVALGSPVLLHAERALALFAVTVAMLSIGVQAARGRLPIELSTSGLRYEAETADRAAAAVAELQEQYDDLLAVVDELADRLDAPQRRP